jgi:hypothetical protein
MITLPTIHQSPHIHKHKHTTVAAFNDEDDAGSVGSAQSGGSSNSSNSHKRPRASTSSASGGLPKRPSVAQLLRPKVRGMVLALWVSVGVLVGGRCVIDIETCLCVCVCVCMLP